MRRIYEYLFVLFSKVLFLDYWVVFKRKDFFFLYFVFCKFFYKIKQLICMILCLDLDFFFFWERDSDLLINYRFIFRFFFIWRESYFCSYVDFRLWFVICYNNVLIINLRFVILFDILIYFREFFFRKILYFSSRLVVFSVKKLGLEICCLYNFFQVRIYRFVVYCILF